MYLDARNDFEDDGSFHMRAALTLTALCSRVSPRNVSQEESIHLLITTGLPSEGITVLPKIVKLSNTAMRVTAGDETEAQVYF
jgi:hypothetical protein